MTKRQAVAYGRALAEHMFEVALREQRDEVYEAVWYYDDIVTALVPDRATARIVNEAAAKRWEHLCTTDARVQID